MRSFAVSFFIGTVVLLGLSSLPSFLALLSSGVLTLALWWAAFRYPVWRNRRVTGVAWVATGMLLGCCYATAVAHQIRGQWWPADQEGQDTLVTGVIADIPEHRADGWHFVLAVDAADGKKFRGKLQLGWYADDTPLLHAGERWQFSVRVKRPNGFSNPNGFDYEQWLFAQRIVGVGSVRKAADNQYLAPAAWFDPNHWRQIIKERLDVALAEQPMLGLVQGLAIADTDNITSEQWRVLRQTGTIHLLAISGLHITMVASLGMLPVLLVWRCFPRLYLWLPVRIAGAVLGGGFATLYSLLAGFNIPTQRTLLMLLVMMAGLVWRRRIPFSVTFSVALLLVLCLDPLAGLSVGFWLSFLTVGLLVFLGSRQRKLGKTAAVGMQLVLSLGTVPLAAGFFGMVSLVSPLANLIAIPVVTFMVTPLVLLGMVCSVWTTLASGLWWFAAWLLGWLMKLLAWMAAWSFAAVYVPLIPALWLLVAGFGFFLLLMPRGMPARWLGVLFLLPMWWYQPARPAVGAFRADVLDVGQGLASVVQTAQHTLVFDTGAKTSPTFDSGEMVVLPWLRGQGIQQVDTLMVSHADNDHSGGAGAVLAGISVRSILVGSSDTLDHADPAKRFASITSPCEHGQHWEWDGVQFTVLNPSSDFPQDKDNNRSCVLRVANANHRLLLTADIERPAENILLKQYETTGELQADVLLVPHHGSKTSSSLAFLRAVAPQLGVITSGYRNRFHHPHPDVLTRYTAQQIQVVNTVDTGALTLFFPADATAFTQSAWRVDKPHWWSR